MTTLNGAIEPLAGIQTGVRRSIRFGRHVVRRKFFIRGRFNA